MNMFRYRRVDVSDYDDSTAEARQKLADDMRGIVNGLHCDVYGHDWTVTSDGRWKCKRCGVTS